MKTFLVLALTGLTLRAEHSAKETTARLQEATTVFSEVMAISDKSIPQDLLERAHCVVIVPSMKKGAFIVGAKYGKGFISCRKASRSGWSAPGAVRIEGGSVGFQIGGSETDVIMLVMNERGADRLLSSKFTIGGEGMIAAGPVGRSATAQTDAKMTAEILSYSRARGAFAGVSLQGSTLREDMDDNASMYGSRLTNREIVDSWRAAPAAATPLLAQLKKYSPHELK